MSQKIKLRRGLNIPLMGKAEKLFAQENPVVTSVAIKPSDFPLVTPKPEKAIGDKVKAGDVIFHDKNRPEVKFTSPVSGILKDIVRGDRRKILEFLIEPDGKNEAVKFEVSNLLNSDKQKITDVLLASGTWPFIRQRPYDVIANPAQTPKAIFISGFDSSPLAPDYDLILSGQDVEFQMGINCLKMLTNGLVHLSYNGAYPPAKIFNNIKGIELHSFEGPHPAGNIGTQIHHIDPINKGEVVWHVNPQDVVIIGRLLNKGIFDTNKIIALAGSQIKTPKYYRTIMGVSIEKYLENNLKDGQHRFISGNVLTGTQIEKDGHLGFYHNQFSVIPDGNHYEFFGWMSPGFNKFSFSHSYFSWTMRFKKFDIDTNLHGGRRALMITGNFEKVFPFDIYPMQLLKAIYIEDIDLMEKLGIYEITEEDFALCEFIDTSKTDIQAIVRKGLDMMIKELN
jgi:Na+-transporting NADH:ubiquinone oxidoreductase subunit A